MFNDNDNTENMKIFEKFKKINQNNIENGEFYITDRGRTLYHLIKADTIEGFTSIIDKILCRRCVTLNAKTWEIFSTATMNNLPKTITRLLSGILAVDSWGLAFEDMKLDRCCIHH